MICVIFLPIYMYLLEFVLVGFRFNDVKYWKNYLAIIIIWNCVDKTFEMDYTDCYSKNSCDSMIDKMNRYALLNINYMLSITVNQMEICQLNLSSTINDDELISFGCVKVSRWNSITIWMLRVFCVPLIIVKSSSELNF